MTTFLPLNKLILSDLNVRKTRRAAAKCAAPTEDLPESAV